MPGCLWIIQWQCVEHDHFYTRIFLIKTMVLHSGVVFPWYWFVTYQLRFPPIISFIIWGVHSGMNPTPPELQLNQEIFQTNSGNGTCPTFNYCCLLVVASLPRTSSAHVWSNTAEKQSWHDCEDVCESITGVLRYFWDGVLFINVLMHSLCIGKAWQKRILMQVLFRRYAVICTRVLLNCTTLVQLNTHTFVQIHIVHLICNPGKSRERTEFTFIRTLPVLLTQSLHWIVCISEQ